MAVSLRYGQKQTVTINVTGIFTKYDKTAGDVSKAVLTLKARETDADSQAAFAKNSVDHASQVSLNYNAGTGVYTVVGIIQIGDFGAVRTKIQPGVDYYVGAGIVFSDEDASQTFELDAYTTDDVVKFIQQRVDTISA